MTNCSRSKRQNNKLMTVITAVMAALLCGQSSAQSTLLDESDPLLKHLDAIDQMEAEYSAYAAELGDLYLALGKIHIERQEYPEALAAYQRGLQTDRINYGLDSVSQTPYLLAVADIEAAMGEWKKSFEAINHIYTISTSSYGQTDPRMADVIAQLLSWHIRWYENRTPKDGFAHLVASEKLSDRLHSVIDQESAINSQQTLDQLRQISRLQYTIAKHITQHREPKDIGVTFSTSGSIASESRPGTSHRHFQKGRDALKSVVRLIAKDPNSSAIDNAESLAHLGDWFLMFNQRRSATESYRLASELLRATDSGEEAEKSFFGTPKLINLLAENTASAPSDDKSATVVFSISRNGVASKFRAIDENQSLSNADNNKLVRKFRSKRFRPVVEGGIIKASEHAIYIDLNSDIKSQEPNPEAETNSVDTSNEAMSG